MNYAKKHIKLLYSLLIGLLSFLMKITYSGLSLIIIWNFVFIQLTFVLFLSLFFTIQFTKTMLILDKELLAAMIKS